jgi:hydroxymethylpyrimidine/phosphomethylpyrimidine kinase
MLSHKRKNVTISSLAGMVSASKALLTLGPEAVLLKGGHVTTTMTEVRELLGANPAISVYKYGLLDENMNILQTGLGEQDRVSQLVVDVLQDSCGSGGEAETSIFIRPRIESTNTHGTGCTLSAAIACGLASGLTSNFSSHFYLSGRLIVVGSAAEAVRDGTVYTYLGILHAFPVGSGHGPLNHAHSVVSRCVPRWVDLLSGSH